MLTQRVRRETEPTTKPSVQDQAINKKAWLISSKNPAPMVSPFAGIFESKKHC